MDETIRLLTLEDCPADLELLKNALDKSGFRFELVNAGSQPEFRQRFEAGLFDVVLLDYNIPGWNGAAALEWVRARAPDLPVIFFTGTIGEEAAVSLLRCGANDYILKDRPSRLPASISQAIKEARLKKANAAAEARLREFAVLLAKSREAIYVIDSDKKISFWNHGAERMFGCSAQEVIGQPILKLFSGEVQQLQAALDQTLQNGEWFGEMRQFSRRQTEMLVESHWSVISDLSSSTPSSILVVSTDVTDKKRLEEALFRAQRLQSLGSLAAGIAHDLKNVLSPILSGIELLQLESTSAKAQQWLALMHSSAEHGAALLRQILAFARGTTERESDLEVPLLVDAVLDILHKTFPANVDVERDLQPNLWRVWGDGTKLKQVLMNLCLNAAEAMPNGGTIHIRGTNFILDDELKNSGAAKGEFIRISISDEGTGISPAIMDRIFDPFFTTKRNDKGTGLGLAMVQSIVQNHGGFVKVETRPGSGATFHVFIPAFKDFEKQRFKYIPKRLLSPGNQELILLVDAAAGIRETTQTILEHYQFRVITAVDGKEGLITFMDKRDEIELVIAESTMPVMDGVTMANAISELDPHTRFLLMAGNKDPLPSDPGSSAHNPRMARLEKPFSLEDLISSVNALLDVG